MGITYLWWSFAIVRACIFHYIIPELVSLKGEKKMAKLTQLEKVRNELNRRKKSGVTSLYCFEQFGITRLSAIIYTLRKKYDLKISSNRIAIKNRYGEKVHFSQYKLEDKEE